MSPDEHYQPVEDDGAQQLIRGVYRCVYCGNVVSSDPHPATASCCGEVGHNEWSEE